MSTAERILIVEDEKLIRMTLRELLEAEGFRVAEADTGTAGLEYLRTEEVDLVLLDYKLPDIDGIEVLRQIRPLSPETAIVLVTAHSSIGSAVEAIKLGAYDYLDKPIDQDHLLATIAKALETTRLRREVKRLRGELKQKFGITNIIGRSDAMQKVFVMIRKVAATAASTVLVQGESGTGKDLVAKAIHFASGRSDKPFMNITCSALTETLLESELFGHERGAFTDARQLKKGLLEIADGSTVFLDEVSEMGPSLQAKLLRFLEDKTFKRVGGAQDIMVDVRVIAATNRDLAKAVGDGDFREDLYFRLKVVPIHLPSLVERTEDIPDLVTHFIGQFNNEFKKNTQGISKEMLECMVRYRWPGNVRELRNVIERAMILENKSELDLTDLPEELVQYASAGEEDDGEASSAAGAPGSPITLPDGGISLRDVEYELVRQALEQTRGNKTRAARLLRISRDALRYKAEKFGLGGPTDRS
jgi:DNA-binding NtrC family response regulator